MAIIVRGLPGRDRDEENPFTKHRNSNAVAAPGPAPVHRSATGKPRRPTGTSLLKAGTPTPKPDLPWWQDGLGILVNNRVSKAALQGLDVVGVPQRAIASLIQEGVDTLQGEGFSFQDLYDQTNPAFFLHGENAEDNHGIGKVWHDATGGGTGNKWLDRTVGFLGDVATDPLTYVAGVGVVDKGLDAMRAGGKLAKYLDEGADAAKAVQAPKGLGNKGSLAGRRTRNTRVMQAGEVIDRMPDSPVKTKMLGELQRRSTRGLGARGKDGFVADLVDEALNIEGAQGLRFRRPGRSSGPGATLPGTGAAMRGASNVMGKLRAGTAGRGGVAEAVSRASSPLDYENAFQVMRQAESVSPERFQKALSVVGEIERARPTTGAYLNLGQRAVSKVRSQIRKEAKAAKGNGKYLTLAEREGGTALNDLFRYLREDLAQAFGITIPKLSDDLNYVPHVYSQKFVERINSDASFAAAWQARYGEDTTDLLTESSRLNRRNLRAGQNQLEIDGEVVDIDFGSGTIEEINQAGRDKMGLDYDILETDPVALVDDYVQIVSEDVGRRAARAEQVALGDEFKAYRGDLVDTRGDEFAAELDAARERLIAQGWDEESLIDFDEAVMDTAGPAYLERMVKQIDSDSGEAMQGVVRKVENQWALQQSNQGLVVDPEIQAMFRNVQKEVRDPNVLKKAWDYGNRYFKTYALLTPGFHARNWLSAIFMNAADGVPIATTGRGAKLWTEITKAAAQGDDIRSGLRWLNKQNKEVRHAFMSVFASGAGGRFTEAGVAEAAGFNRFMDRIAENRMTRGSQHAGAFVEGSARMGMALDTIENGGSITDATQRITRVHFDYSQTSRFDDKAKQLAPFWSFFSRNIPMQIAQQWARPRSYSTYQHFRANFRDDSGIPADGEVPDYIEAGGGIPVDLPFGINWFEPDLPHTRVTEDIQRLADFGQNPIGMASNLSPLLTAPLEYAMGQNTFTGQTYGADDYTKVGWNADILTNILALPPALLTGNLKTGADGIFISDRLLNAVESTNPLAGQFGRVADVSDQRFAERLMRYAGLPVRTITEDQMESYEYWNRQDEYEQEALRRLLDGE